MRVLSFAPLIGGARCALVGSLLWLANPVGAQEPTRPARLNAAGTVAPLQRATPLPPVKISPAGTPSVSEPVALVRGASDAQPAPITKPEGPDLLDLPLEQLAAQPIRLTTPEAVAVASAPGNAANLFSPVPIVTSASRREEKVTAAPAGVVVIDRREIVQRGYSQLTDVLRDLPGIETIEYFQEWGTQVPVRGIVGNNKIVVLVNGMRVNPPGGENFPFNSDFSVRFAERIEVVYGSGGVLYGQDAISAVINIVTKKPGDEAAGAFDADQLAKTNSKLTVQMGADGGVNLARDAYGWFGGVLDEQHKITYTGYVQYHDSALTPIDKEFPTYWQDYKNIALPKTNADGLTPHRQDYGLNLFGRVEGYDSAVQVWHREAQRNSAEGYSPVLAFTPQAIWADQSDVVEGKNTLHLTDKVTLESTVGYNRYEVKPITRFVEPEAPPLTSTQYFLDDHKYGLGWQGRQEETLRVELPDRISLLVGENIFYSDIIPKSTFPGGFGSKPGSPVQQGGSFFYSQTPGGPLIAIPRVTEAKYWDYSPYMEAQWQVLDRLRLIGGFRVTWDDRFQEVPITPRAGVVYNLTDKITAKYIYTEGFVAPAPYFADAVFDRGDILSTTNPNLAPESSKTHEFVLAYNRENFSLTVNPYYGIQSNLITFNQQNLPVNFIESPVFLNGDPNQQRTLVQTANGGTSQRFGVDLYGKGKFGPIRPWFSYSYVDFTENAGGVITGLPGISRHNGRLGATWEVSQKLFITPSLVIRSTPEGTDPGKLADELRTPYEINLSALYMYSANVEFFVNLRNITNHHYALAGLAGTAIPQETFNGVVGLQVRY